MDADDDGKIFFLSDSHLVLGINRKIFINPNIPISNKVKSTALNPSVSHRIKKGSILYP